jgi:tellurite resistance protein
MPHDAFESRRSGFETEYFHNKDVKLVEKLKTVFRQRLDREELARITGVKDPTVLDRMLAVHAKGEMLLAFRLYPLIDIAWADGKCDSREVKAVIDSAIKFGVKPDSPALHTIENWLKTGARHDARTAWYAYAGELRKTLDHDELATFRHDLLEGAKAVAKASGGILGVGFEISAKEQKVLDEIAKALTHA